MDRISDRECVPVGIAHLIGRKWFFPTIEEIALSENGIGFNDLLRRIKYITPRDLISLLDSMRRYSLLGQVQAVGKHRLYRITVQGKSLYEVVGGMKSMPPSKSGANGFKGCDGVKCTECKWYSRDYWTSSMAVEPGHARPAKLKAQSKKRNGLNT